MWKRKTLKPAQHGIQGSILVPFIEEIPCGRPRSILARKISPRSASAQGPEDSVENHPSVAWTPAGLEVPNRKQVGNRFPLAIGQLVARHSNFRHAHEKIIRSSFRQEFGAYLEIGRSLVLSSVFSFPSMPQSSSIIEHWSTIIVKINRVSCLLNDTSLIER